jgi:hypothetical protein
MEEVRNCILMDNTNMSYYVGDRSWSGKNNAIKMTRKRAKKVAFGLCKKFGFMPSFYTIIHLRV